MSLYPQYAVINANMAPAALRATAAMTSAWVAVRRRGTPAAAWPAGTSCMGTPVWRNALLDTMSSTAGAVSALPSVRFGIRKIPS